MSNRKYPNWFFIWPLVTILYLNAAFAQIDIKVAPVFYLPNSPESGIYSLSFDVMAKSRDQVYAISAFQGALELDSLFQSLNPNVVFDLQHFPETAYFTTCDYTPENGRIRFVYTWKNENFQIIGMNWTTVTRITILISSDRTGMSLTWYEKEPNFFVSSESFIDITGNKQEIPDLFQKSTLVFQFPNEGMYPISLPGTQSDMRLSVLFPLSPVCFGYLNGHYVDVDTLMAGYGYWLYVPGDVAPLTISLQLIPLNQYSRVIERPGWHLLGSASQNSPAFTVPNNRGLLPLREYDINAGEYIFVDETSPQKAFWLAVTDCCSVHLGATPALPGKLLTKSENLLYPAPPEPPVASPAQKQSDAINCLQLYQNFPNPFNPLTTITWQIPKTEHLAVKIFNTNGQVVKTLCDKKCKKGFYQAVWDGTDNYFHPVCSGIYLVRLEADNDYVCRKIIFMK